ncbi:MAG: adenylosuccinate synthetase, partial [Patescibacteria group bacterium]
MSQKQATIVVGLGFGDEGKGTMVDYFTQTGRVSAVVRFNGGPQARHGVVTPDGRHHSFSQFGSGSFKAGVRTHLSRFMLVDPIEMLVEARVLHQLYCRRVFELMSVDEDAMIITPFHKDANFIRERARGRGVHGSCGMGIGETMHLSLMRPDLIIRAKELKDLPVLTRKLRLIQEYFRAEFADDATYGEIKSLRDSTTGESRFSSVMPSRWAEVLHEAAQHLTVVSGDYLHTLGRAGSLVFEGAQGVLLDEWYGFHPHTTWSTTT